MLKKRINSFRYAIAGIFDLIKTQPNVKIHLAAAVIVVLLGIYFSISATEWMFCVFAITFVLAAEATNTSLEYIVDLISPEQHPLAGKAKDVAAAAVLFSAIGAAIVGLIIFLPKILVSFL